MSAQPYSRADRNRVRRAFRDGHCSLIVTAVDEDAGSITVTSESLLAARCIAGRPQRRPPAPSIPPPRRVASIAVEDNGVTYNFRPGRSYERLPDGSWLVTEGE